MKAKNLINWVVFITWVVVLLFGALFGGFLGYLFLSAIR